MKRRKFLLATGAAAAGGASLLGSGAFSSVQADRDISVEVASDSDAFLRLAPCEGSPNGDYVVGADVGTMALDLTGENDNVDGAGVNAEAVTTIDNVFEICNQGTQDVCVDFAADVPAIPGPVPDRFDFEEGDPAVVFYRGSDRDELVSTEGPNTDRPGAIQLSIDNGECECIGIQVRAFGFEAGDAIFDEDAELTIRADADGNCEDGVSDPTPGFQQLDTELYIDTVFGNVEEGELSRESDRLSFRAEIGEEDNGGSTVHLAVGTTSPFDLTDIDEVKIDWEELDDNDGDQDQYFFGVDQDRSLINRENMDKDDQEDPEVFDLRGPGTFDREITALDVTGLDGEYHIGTGIQVSSNDAQNVELNVFDVWGKDTDGNRVFEFAIPGN